MIILPLGSLAGVLLGWLMAFLSLFLIMLILIQRGKGGGLTGALGGPGGQSAFGSKAGDTFTAITIVVASLWGLTCVITMLVLGTGAADNAVADDPALQPAPAEIAGETAGSELVTPSLGLGGVQEEPSTDDATSEAAPTSLTPDSTEASDEPESSEAESSEAQGSETSDASETGANETEASDPEPAAGATEEPAGDAAETAPDASEDNADSSEEKDE